MAGFTDTLRGDGLARAQRALAGLERDPLRLGRERQRFSRSPPLYTSDRSGTTTRSASPNPLSGEQQLHQERRRQLACERMASEPYEQFGDQISDEKKRIIKADLNRTRRLRVGDNADEIAYGNVKKCWVEQGIWNNTWNKLANGQWKHEEPLELESESEIFPEIETFTIFDFPPKQLQPTTRRPKSDDEKRQIAERRIIREREREASRPYHQFVYQISKERKRIQEESEIREGANDSDINTRAYENVKNTWTRRGIWNRRWGILPGMLWKHEEPLNLKAADSPDAVPASPLVNSSHEAGEAPAVHVFGSHSPVESRHHYVSGALNSSQQGPPADIDPARSEYDNAERSSSMSNSPPTVSDERVCPTMVEALLPSKREGFHKDGQPANAFFGPPDSSDISKATGKREGPQQRLNISPQVSFDDLPLSSGVNAVKPQPSPSPDRVAPRRSKRIRPPIPSVSKDPRRAASTSPSKRAVPSKPERNLASSLTARSSAKPQGISKKQPAKIMRGGGGGGARKNKQLDTQRSLCI